MLLPQAQCLRFDLDPVAAEALCLIVERSDFIAFKATALLELEEIQRRNEASNLGRATLGPLKDLCKPSDFQIEDLAGISPNLLLPAENACWLTALDLDWMKFHYLPSKDPSNRDVHIRSAWVVNLTIVECCDMLLTHDNRRSAWDTNFRGATL